MRITNSLYLINKPTNTYVLGGLDNFGTQRPRTLFFFKKSKKINQKCEHLG